MAIGQRSQILNKLRYLLAAGISPITEKSPRLPELSLDGVRVVGSHS
jgi:hypothetical protein